MWLAAQAAGAADAPPLTHVVRPGDTLYGLAESYLEDPLLWPELQRANDVPNPRRLEPGSTITIPADLLDRTRGASVVHVSGAVTLVRDGAGQALAVGMRVRDGDVVRTEQSGFATLELLDGSVVRITGDSELQMHRARYMIRSKRADTVLDLGRGRVESSVTPQAPGGSRFRVRTPLMAAGVRGTEFGVSLTAGGAMTADVLDGSVQLLDRDAAARVAPPASGGTLVAAGQGVAVTGAGASAPVPLLPAPDLGAIPELQQRPLIDLSFPAVPGAASYRGFLSRDAQLDFVVANAVFPGPRLRFEGIDDGDYVAVVRAIDANGIEGRPSIRAFRLKARPEPPVTLAPQDGGEVSGGTVTLRWTTGAGAGGYDVQLARDPRFADLLLDRHDAGDGSLETPQLPSGVYYWRVRTYRLDATGQADAGPYGDPRKFSMRREAAPPSAPEQHGDELLFRWDGEPGQRYLLQIGRDPEFTSIVQEIRTGERQATLGGLEGGTYYLRVQATDPDGYVRRFTTPQRFRVLNVVRSGSGQPLNASDGSAVDRP
ncbi:FecR domain-containing protein [Pigmentiphaga soli]|uniref:FecR domain-containing protein n=2 Tax=Pigmentiphaga soli TaxID=1007095 RepID=A0ABP8H6X0_9BURK